MNRQNPLFKSLPTAFAITSSLLILYPEPAQAACTLTPGVGNDTFTCDSGNSGPLTDLSGDNSLTFPATGTGSIIGNVSFGAGNDRVVMDSGTITGTLNQGDGQDTLQINAGQIAGAVRQGSGIDDFIMSGGRIQSLAQGDGLDTFLMTGGTIVGAFEDGDIAKMTGGTIGRVDMKLDDNTFDLSGGEIIGNLVTGFGTDTIIVSGGRIGGNVSVSGGDDSITVTGGVIDGEIRASNGNDRLLWEGGGLINSAILMGDGNDSTVLRNLAEAILSSTPNLDGGPGNDTLTFDSSTSGNPARYIHWETVNLGKDSIFNLAGNFVLGDSVTGAGVFNIDASSALEVSEGSISPFTSGRLTTLNNAGVIDMRSGNSRTSDSLTVQGNYVGNKGQLRLQSVLGDDLSASDKLVVNNGNLSGNTRISVSNLGGLGALTRQNGIQLVEAQGTAVSDAQAFSLKGTVTAGAYDYHLYKGGVTPGTENSWYLRSAVVAPAVVTVANPDPSLPPISVPVVAVPVAAAGTPALPAAVPGAAPIPLYRQEVPVWSALVPAAATLTLTALGTFHERQGEQRLLTETGALGAGWGRAYGKSLDRTWAGTVTPSLKGSLSGFQIGHDVYGSHTSGGQTQRSGFFLGQTRLRGDIDGFNQGYEGRRAGKLKYENYSLGLYWTLTDPQGRYLDMVAMGTRLDGHSSSERGLKIRNRGHALSLSAEAGYPIALPGNWVFEPQVQAIYQQISLDSQDDGISRVSFDSDSAWTGRLGVRLKGAYEVNGMPVEPYLRSNLWQTFDGTDTVTFDNATRITTEQKASSADIGIGLVVSLTSSVSLYSSVDYSTHLDSNDLEGFAGNLGIRVSW